MNKMPLASAKFKGKGRLHKPTLFTKHGKLKLCSPKFHRDVHSGKESGPHKLYVEDNNVHGVGRERSITLIGHRDWKYDVVVKIVWASWQRTRCNLMHEHISMWQAIMNSLEGGRGSPCY